MGGVALSVFLVAVGAVSVGGFEDDLPGSFCVWVFCAVASQGVVVCPCGEVDGIAVPRHLGVEIEGEGIGVQSFGE